MTQYYLGARICSGSVEPRTPRDFFGISSIICGTQGLKTSKDFKSRTASAVKSKGWVVLLFHGVDDDGGWSPIPSDTLRAMLEHLKQNDAQFWVASFGGAVRYIRERNAVSVAESAGDGGRLTVQVTDTLDDAIFGLPVTLRRPLPPGWPAASVTQGGVPVESRIVDADGSPAVQFDAVPDGGEVAIVRTEAGAVGPVPGAGPRSPELGWNYPNPFNPSTAIGFALPSYGRVTLTVHDAGGREVAVLVDGFLNAGAHRTEWNAAAFGSGVYFCRMQAGHFSAVRKLLLLK
jgi:hypothetical protein